MVTFVVISENPLAQGIREVVGWKHDQSILDASFSVGPHTFRYYKFSLPQGSANVAVAGQFAVESHGQADAADGGIEVYVLTDAAFTEWQHGDTASALYDSGRVLSSTLQADIPSGPGVYYLVFSNKPSLKAATALHASVALRYKNWLRRALTRHG